MQSWLQLCSQSRKLRSQKRCRASELYSCWTSEGRQKLSIQQASRCSSEKCHQRCSRTRLKRFLLLLVSEWKSPIRCTWESISLQMKGLKAFYCFLSLMIYLSHQLLLLHRETQSHFRNFRWHSSLPDAFESQWQPLQWNKWQFQPPRRRESFLWASKSQQSRSKTVMSAWSPWWERLEQEAQLGSRKQSLPDRRPRGPSRFLSCLLESPW